MMEVEREIETVSYDESFRVELDSHADTCCVGNGVMIVNTTSKTVKVSPFLKSLGSVPKVPIVTAAIAYDDPISGEVMILVVHQALYFSEMNHCLLCPMQIRLNDVVLNERPKFLTHKPTSEDHAILVEDLLIPLELSGVTSVFPGRKPTQEEYDTCGRYELTYPEPEWVPSTDDYAKEEAKYTDENGLCRDFDRNVSVYVTHDEERFINELNSLASLSSKKNVMSPDGLMKTWDISKHIAENTIKATTHKAVHTVAYPSVERRWPTGDRPLRYKRLNHAVFHDNLKANITSSRGNNCAEIYATDFGWSRIFPMKKESDVHESLDMFLSRYGIPESLVSDGAKAYTGGEYKKKAKEAGVFCKVTDPYSPWQNRAESEIREVKRLSGRWMIRSASPRRLWDHCLELASLVRSHTALNIFKLQGEVPETMMMGQTADISHLAEFKWYDWIYYNESIGKFPDPKQVLGRYLGPTDPEIGSVMAAKILTSKGEVIRRNTFRTLTPEEYDSESNREERNAYNKAVVTRLGDPLRETDLASSLGVAALTPEYEAYEDEEAEQYIPSPDLDDYESEHEGFNGYITAQVLLPKGGEMKLGIVSRRRANSDGTMVGRSNENPILDTRVYEVEFGDGEVLEYAANVIAENLYSQVDTEGRRYILLDSIIDHARNGQATLKDDEFVTKNGRRHRRITTKGWKLCVQWKDGSTSWEPLRTLKETNPVEVAAYADANKLASEPAFAWWVPYTLRKKDRIIAAVNSRYLKRNHKFGIELPKTVKQAIEIDTQTGTSFWRDAIDLEIKNVNVAFQDLENKEKVPIGYQQIRCHMIFDIKVGSLKRKARYVAGGHTTKTPAALTYASVVSRESIRLGLMIAALNDLEIFSADIQNAYLTSPCHEKIWTVLGPEFGPERMGRKALIVRALYGLKSAGAAFRNHLASCLGHLGYQSSKGDPDVWFRPATKVTGEKYYEYLFVYTDDILAIGVNPKEVLARLNKYFSLKPDSIHPPDDYLGTKIKKTTLPNGQIAWGQSSSHYVNIAVSNLEKWMKPRGYTFPKKVATPMISSYKPEIDVSPCLDDELANYYQSLVGVLRWIIECGRLDITTEVSMLAAHMAMPRIGHLHAAFRVFAYLKLKHNARLIFDPTYPNINFDTFKDKEDWIPFYGDVKEAIPPNAPEPRGRSVILRTYVDSDHAGNLVTRRSRTGYVQMINMSVINWFSKKQGSVECASFGSEFVAAKTAVEANRALRYKLRMMGVPIDGPTYMYCDNMSVVNNTTAPESMLKKKSNSICYHAVREAVAMGEILITYIRTDDNIADVMTKVLPGGERRDKLIEAMLWDI